MCKASFVSISCMIVPGNNESTVFLDSLCAVKIAHKIRPL